MNLGLGLRNLSRLREILSVLVFDYGFGYVFDQLGLSRHLPLGRRRPAGRYADLPGPRRLRLALAELGPTFMKLGQMLSARRDLLPPAMVAELRGLQDEGPTVPFAQIRGTVETELGRPIEQCFARFDPVPLSSASLGQVHAAALTDGRDVTVKVLRPEVPRLVQADLQILTDGAYLLHRQVPALQRYNLPAFVRQFASQLEDELEYTFEAHNAERIRLAIANAEIKVRIPEVIWPLTTAHVLTTERLAGYRTDRLPEDLSGPDRAALAHGLGRCFLHQILVEGFFHGDPHQGNVLVGDDGCLILLDFGIVGYLDRPMRRLLAEAVRRAFEEDLEGLTAIMTELGTVAPETDQAALRSDLSRIVSRLALLPRQDFPIGELLGRTIRTLWLNHVRVPPELALTAKTLLMTEAICSELDPTFDFRTLARPVLEEARAKMLAPEALGEQALRSIEATARHLARMPAQLGHVLSLIERGGLRIRTESPDADARWGRLGRGINRLCLSLLTLALLVSGAIYLVSGQQPTHVALGAAAMAGAVLLGLIVIIGALRPGQG
jgi:ubiquinone biosynthesis protein